MLPRTNNSLLVQRAVLVAELGGKCSCSGDGCWHDGPCGMDDRRCLQLDHINGDGAADRKRLGRSHISGYYYSRLVEARQKIQLLCANCNWVKRVQNGEIRNGGVDRGGVSKADMGSLTARRTVVLCRLSGIPLYHELRAVFLTFLDVATDNVEEDLVDGLRRLGIAENPSETRVFNLAREWMVQGYFGNDVAELTRFLAEKMGSLDVAIKCLTRRMTRCAAV